MLLLMLPNLLASFPPLDFFFVILVAVLVVAVGVRTYLLFVVVYFDNGCLIVPWTRKDNKSDGITLTLT